VLDPRDPLGLLHQEGPDSLVLEQGRVPGVHRYRGAVDVQLADHRALAVLEELLPECALLGALAQAKEADEDIPLRVLVRQERLPPAVSDVIAPDKFELVRLRGVTNDRVSSSGGGWAESERP